MKRVLIRDRLSMFAVVPLLAALVGCGPSWSDRRPGVTVSPAPDDRSAPAGVTIAPGPMHEPVPAIETANVTDALRRLNDELSNRGRAYRQVMEDVLRRQIAFCDGTGRPQRVKVSWDERADGELAVSLESPGRDDYGDFHNDAITLRDGAVVGLTFRVLNSIDSCPCQSMLSPEYVTDAFLESLVAIDTLESIDLADSQISDTGLVHLARLKNLRSLRLEATSVTAEGFLHLAPLKKLDTFKFSPKSPAERGALRLGRLLFLTRHPGLRHLELNSVELDEGGIEAIRALPRLEQLNLQGRFVGAGEFRALRGHASLQSAHLTVHFPEPVTIDVGDMPALTEFHLYATGQDVDISVGELPVARSVAVTAVRRARQDENNVPAEEVGRSPRISISHLPQLQGISLGLRDGFFQTTDSPGIARLDTLPELSSLYCSNMEGRLDVRTELPKLHSFTAYCLADPADVYGAFSRFPNLETAKVAGPTEAATKLNQPVSAETLAPVFQLKKLHTLQISDVKGSPLGFDLFLQLPELRDLTLRRCVTADPFEATSHPRLEVLSFQEGAPQRITVRDMPKLERFTVVGSPDFQSAELSDCPLLDWCWCTNTPNLATLDLQRLNRTRPTKLNLTVTGREDLVVVLGEE